MLAPGMVEAFRLQGEFCGKFGSPLYAELLARAADDIERGGPVARALDEWAGNPIPDAVVLRLMGAVHRRVLDGLEPALARYYPSAGGRPEWPVTWQAFLDVVETHAAALRPALDRHVQTNEVRRSAALLGGFLTVAAAWRLPLRLLEIGSSAGLNLCFDRYRFEVVPNEDGPAHYVWGPADSPATVRTGWHGPLANFDTPVSVTSRAGCDVAPVDITDPSQVRTLESFIWADQLERLTQLRSAVDLVRREPHALVRQRAADFLAAELGEPRQGAATIVFHSIMWWYLSEDEREQVTATIAAAGARATAGAPLAWLKLELMRTTEPDLLLTQWPGGTETTLGRADAHGRYVRWGNS